MTNINTERALTSIANDLFKLLGNMDYPGLTLEGLWTIDRSIYPNAFKIVVNGKTYWVDVTEDKTKS